MPDDDDPRQLSLYANPSRYDAIAESVSDDLLWWQQCLGTGPQSILELGCGTGRISLLLAAMGHRVIGLDCVAAMLQHARSKPGAAEVQWIEGDMRRLDAVDELSLGAFDAVIIANNTLAHVHTVAQLLDICEYIQRLLKPGGSLWLDCFAPSEDLLHPGSEDLVTYIDPSDGAMVQVVEEHSCDSRGELMQVRWYHCRADETRDQARAQPESMVLRLWQPGDIRAAAHVAGLQEVQACGDYDASPLDEESPLMLFRFRRPAD
ncbi:MAG: class I SAM-dependent methyltransferase [Planctomycetota bacterium]|nr:MAG: class I SAM-dependent methyltransferase [Planctomycetota bacterium]